MVGQFISLLQDTTLLSLIGLLELLGVARTVMANPSFLGRNGEVYLTLAVLFWFCCAALGLGSRAWSGASIPSTRVPPGSPGSRCAGHRLAAARRRPRSIPCPCPWFPACDD